MEKEDRRNYGAHLTPIDIFNKYILPKIENKLNNYVWVDLYCGEGNLILPILEKIPLNERINFFKENIFLFDIQKEMIDSSIKNAIKYGIPKEIAKKNIILKDTLKEFPHFLNNLKKPIYHITNPPYLYLGYISKHKENKNQLEYFEGKNKGYQDLYQIALINDLNNNIKNMIYIIPSNFLFGFSNSNKIRKDFLSKYTINEAIIFEKKIFNFTGTNVIICFFEKNKIENERIEFNAKKINSKEEIKKYCLIKKNNYKAGNLFDEFILNNKVNDPIQVEYYLTEENLIKNKGDFKLVLLDSKEYINKSYSKKEFFVNRELFDKIKLNPIFIKTVDSGSENGKAGIFNIVDTFGVDGIFVKGNTYRTNPIQIFTKKKLNFDQISNLIEKFNKTLENLRDKTDGDFMTTFKYSNSKYIRKYLGLSQAKKIFETIDIKTL